MSQTARAILVLLLAVVAVSAGNLCFGLAGRPLVQGTASPDWVKSLSQIGALPLRIIGGFGHALFFFAWMWVLTQLPLSVAAPISGAALGLTALAGYLFLGEPIVALRWVGIVLIMIGVVLVGLTEKQDEAKPPPPQDTHAPSR